ncbi:MAG: hypothetical protein IJ825_03570 [Oscillospiraceae bacterium]|nr:hypothetical protein [Oscillospiraceae bacterium]
MGFFAEQREKHRQAERELNARVKEHTHMALSRMPRKFGIRVLPQIVFRSTVLAAVSGAVCFLILRGMLRESEPAMRVILGLLAILPVNFCIGALRRLTEVLTGHYTLYGGVVTELKTKTEERWNSDEHRYEKHYTYFVSINGNSPDRIDRWDHLWMQKGEFYLIPTFRRRYMERDVRYYIHAPLALEEEQLEVPAPPEPVRLYARSQMPTGATVTAWLSGFAFALVLFFYFGLMQDDHRIPVWLMPAIAVTGTLALAALVWGLYKRFSDEAKRLDLKRKQQS